MKLYVCWGTFKNPLRPGGHPCGNAYHALKDAGYEPEVVKAYGLAPLPDLTSGRKEVKKLTGKSLVPVLMLDEGHAIHDSKKIVEWAKAHPAGRASAEAAA